MLHAYELIYTTCYYLALVPGTSTSTYYQVLPNTPIAIVTPEFRAGKPYGSPQPVQWISLIVYRAHVTSQQSRFLIYLWCLLTWPSFASVRVIVVAVLSIAALAAVRRVAISSIATVTLLHWVNS